MKRDRTYKNGFTLIEIVVVMAIIAVLAVLVVGAINVARNAAKEATHRNNAKTIQTALEAYYAKHKKYPLNVPQPPLNPTHGEFYFITLTGPQWELDLSLSPTPECDNLENLESGNYMPGGGSLVTIPDGYIIAPRGASCDNLDVSPDDVVNVNCERSEGNPCDIFLDSIGL